MGKIDQLNKLKQIGPAGPAPVKQIEDKKIPTFIDPSEYKPPIADPILEEEVAIEEALDEVIENKEDGSVKTAGFMGLPTIAWILIGGAVVYFAFGKQLGIRKK